MNIFIIIKLPYVFTEQGVAMLTSVLKTDVASKISVGTYICNNEKIYF